MIDHKRRSTLPLLVTALSLPVLYVLSIGPAYWFVVRFKLQSHVELLYYFYFPMLWAANQSDQVMSVIQWYLHMWIDF
jgi:hypothetical protein